MGSTEVQEEYCCARARFDQLESLGWAKRSVPMCDLTAWARRDECAFAPYGLRPFDRNMLGAQESWGLVYPCAIRLSCRRTKPRTLCPRSLYPRRRIFNEHTDAMDALVFQQAWAWRASCRSG